MVLCLNLRGQNMAIEFRFEYVLLTIRMDNQYGRKMKKF